jgi:hypothetical protein
MRGVDLTEEQIQNLIRAYQTGGLKGSEALAKEYKINRKYPYFLVRERGLKPFNYGYTKAQYKPTKIVEDHRWQWAIERGPVIA